MDFISEGMSIAEMVASAASEVYHSKVPPGFEWIEEYKQYYSRDTGYFYDPNTGLFFHNDSQTYYIFNEETYQYEIYKCIQKLKWSGKRHEIRAKRVLGDEFDKLDQNSADLCGIILTLVDKVCKKEMKQKNKATMEGDDEEGRLRFLKKQLAKQQKQYKNREAIQTDDPSFVCFYSEEQNEPGTSSEDDEYSDLESETGEVLDERVQMMEDERISQPPLIRLIDDQKNLHIMTIPGGKVGRNPESEVILDHPVVPEKLLELTFVPESNSFVMKKLTYLRVLLNDYEVEFDEDREIEHGDIVSFQGKSLTLHVHYGNNTCPGCEPGLLQTNEPVTTVSRVLRGETARRRNMKMLKAAYCLNDYQEQKHTGFDRAAHRRKYIGSEGPEIKRTRNDGTVYGGCLARPVAAPSTSSTPKPTPPGPAVALGAENKGFKLLKAMGWKQGEGLGKDNLGRIDPVMNQVKANRAGLGAGEQPQKPKYNSKKEEILDVTRRRYEQINPGQ